MSGSVHTPRYRVTLNGAVLAGVQKISITPAYIFQVAKFSITKVFVANDPYPPSYWAATGNKTLLIGLEVSTDGKSFTTIISGNVDSHSWDWVANTLTAVGRDLGAAFLDTRTVGTYRNQSAAQIATTLAQSHGLKINATATGPLVGRTYDIDFDKTAGGDFADSTNEWDLLCRLGNQQGIIPYMQGDTLYFNPPPTTPPVYVLTLSRTAHGAVASVEGVQFERHLTVARDVIVTVQSWNSRKKRTFSATYRVTTKDASAGGGTPPHPVHYYQRTPNLTQAQCQAIAQQKALDISTHERNVTIKAPSLVVLTPLHVVQVSGTGTDYDMTYYPQTITYEIDFEGGATTSIQAKFSSAAYLYDEDTGQIVGEQA